MISAGVGRALPAQFDLAQPKSTQNIQIFQRIITCKEYANYVSILVLWGRNRRGALRCTASQVHAGWHSVTMPVLELNDTEPAGWLNYEVHGAGPERLVAICGFMTSIEAMRGLLHDFKDNTRFTVRSRIMGV